MTRVATAPPSRSETHRLASVIAVAASAGGLNALSHLLAALPADLRAAVVVVQHMDPHRPSHLAEILGRRTQLRVKQAVGHDLLTHGTVFIAPPNSHLVVGPDRFLSLSETPPIHFLRPSADPLFASVAETFRERAVAVVLTGTGSDGAAGTEAVKRFGGTVIVQDEATSAFFGMPDAAIRGGHVDLILPLHSIPPALVKLVGTGAVS
jgi:two-component system, chemotaxis family, protein-glutamate methylesterase/glutaminase